GLHAALARWRPLARSAPARVAVRRRGCLPGRAPGAHAGLGERPGPPGSGPAEPVRPFLRRLVRALRAGPPSRAFRPHDLRQPFALVARWLARNPARRPAPRAAARPAGLRRAVAPGCAHPVDAHGRHGRTLAPPPPGPRTSAPPGRWHPDPAPP